MSEPMVTILVNTRQKEVEDHKRLTYADLVTLAGFDPKRVYSVTAHYRVEGLGPVGLSIGTEDYIHARPRLIVDVTDTSNA